MPKIDDDEALVFRHAMRGVRPLRQDTVVPEPSRPAPRLRIPPSSPARDPGPPWRDAHDHQDSTPHSQGTLSFARPGVQDRVLRRLRRGQYSVEDRLDLHGLTREQARTALACFLGHGRSKGLRCVLVVHGKGTRSPHGRAVLKHNVDAWLRQCDGVLAFCSARPADGGGGAVYVLLRR